MKVEEFSTLQYRELLLANKVQDEGLGRRPGKYGRKVDMPQARRRRHLTWGEQGEINSCG
jgi:hypothetical protein